MQLVLKLIILLLMITNHFILNIFDEKNFSDNDLLHIISKFKQVKFLKDDFLLREGQIVPVYWFLETGHIRSYVYDHEGNDVTTELYTPGNIVIDWPSFFLRNPTLENFQALSDCVCWQIDYENFQILFNQIEKFRNECRNRLVSSYAIAQKRKLAIITDGAKDRYLKLLLERPDVIHNIPLKHISSYLGITNSSLSRIRKEIC